MPRIAASLLLLFASFPAQSADCFRRALVSESQRTIVLPERHFVVAGIPIRAEALVYHPVPFDSEAYEVVEEALGANLKRLPREDGRIPKGAIPDWRDRDVYIARLGRDCPGFRWNSPAGGLPVAGGVTPR